MKKSKLRDTAELFGNAALRIFGVVWICLATNVVLLLLLLRNWGTNQDITPEMLRSLEIGMSSSDSALYLGLSEMQMGISGTRRRATVAVPGLGKFFVVQHRVDLDFNANDQLEQVHVEVAYATDERDVRIDLQKPAAKKPDGTSR